MGAKLGVIGGLVVGVVMGGGGALGAHHLADRVKIQPPPVTRQPAAAPQAELTRIEGQVEVIGPAGNARAASAGSPLPRPAGLVTTGVDGEAQIAHNGTHLIASRDARVFFDGPGTPLDVFLERGRLVLHRDGASISTTIPGESLAISGGTYGVWHRGDRVLVSVLAGDAKVVQLGKETVYAAGREVVLTPDGANVGVFPPKLTLYVDRADARGDGYEIRGKTSPTAEVVVRRGDRYESVAVAPSGVFTTRIAGARPAPGELIAFDSVGRRAEVGSPSMSLDARIATLTGQTPPPEPAAAAPAEPAKTEPAPEPAKAEPEAAKAEPEPEPAKAEPAPEPEPANAEPAKAEAPKPAAKPRPRRRPKPRRPATAAPADAPAKPAAKPKADEDLDLEWE